MTSVATALSFLDRQVLSISIILIKKDFFISDVEYGFINTGFLISYAIMFSLGGILIDRYGSRMGLSFSVGLWSFATLLHSLARNALHFGIFRFLLGLGEGGAFPGAIKAVTERVPKDRQSLANGIAIGGSALGAVIAPPLCVYLLGIVGWRGIFIVTGIIGFLWVAAWFFIPKINPVPTERKTVSGSEDTDREYRPRLALLLRQKEAWIFIVIRFLLDPIFYFYMFWIPKYLNEARGIELEKIGRLLWMPFFALGVANMLGGWLSDMIYRKTTSLNIARKTVMGFAALLTMSAIFVRYVQSPWLVIAIMCAAFLAHGLWITNYITSTGDIFGRFSTSTIIGFSGTAGAVSGLIINPVIGLIVTKYSYDPMWIYSGLMYPVAFLIFLGFIPKIRPVLSEIKE
jgi:ACS family hexuronate transporter-like MFS transporter